MLCAKPTPILYERPILSGRRLCGFPSILWSAVMGTLWFCEYSVDKVWGMTFNHKAIWQRSHWTRSLLWCFQDFLKEFRIPFEEKNLVSLDFDLCLIPLSVTHTIFITWNVCTSYFFFYKRWLSPRRKTLNYSFLTQLLFLVSVSHWNVLWEVFNTSETEQEEGGILTSAAECLIRIRSANASQTKTVLFVSRSTRNLQGYPYGSLT